MHCDLSRSQLTRGIAMIYQVLHRLLIINFLSTAHCCVIPAFFLFIQKVAEATVHSSTNPLYTKQCLACDSCNIIPKIN